MTEPANAANVLGVSTLMLDDREDKRLWAELVKFTDIPVEIFRLEAGDACWVGRGAGGSRVVVGVEHKRLADLAACVQDRRLSGSQLVGMWKTYDRVELVIEGIWRPSASGMVEEMSGGTRSWHPLYHKREGLTYQAVDGYLQSLSECGDVRVWRTQSVEETAHWYASRWRWWQKPYDRHRSHDQIYSTDPQLQHRGRMVLHRGEPSPVVQHAAQVPGVDAKAWAVGEHFASVRDMANAGVVEWSEVLWTDSAGVTKRIGKKTAKRIVEHLQGNGRSA